MAHPWDSALHVQIFNIGIPLGKGFNQNILEDKDSATNLITMSPCHVRNTWLFMHKWTCGSNPEKASQHNDSMKKVTILFPRLSLEYNMLLPTIGNSFDMMLDEELMLANRLNKHLGPPSIRYWCRTSTNLLLRCSF